MIIYYQIDIIYMYKTEKILANFIRLSKISQYRKNDQQTALRQNISSMTTV